MSIFTSIAWYIYTIYFHHQCLAQLHLLSPTLPGTSTSTCTNIVWYIFTIYFHHHLPGATTSTFINTALYNYNICLVQAQHPLSPSLPRTTTTATFPSTRRPAQRPLSPRLPHRRKEPHQQMPLQTEASPPHILKGPPHSLRLARGWRLTSLQQWWWRCRLLRLLEDEEDRLVSDCGSCMRRPRTCPL